VAVALEYQHPTAYRAQLILEVEAEAVAPLLEHLVVKVDRVL
jgi:hypothetical protein